MTTTEVHPVLVCEVLGTLVDWDAGLAAGLEHEAGVEHPAQVRKIIARRWRAEWDLLDEVAEFRSYREVLAETLVSAAASSGTVVSRAAAGRIAASAGDWPLFVEVPAALKRLSRRFRIALTSNLDRDDLQKVAVRLGVAVAHIVSADDVQIYKPAPELVLALLHEMELDETEAIVVSGLADLDLYTAEDLGISAAFVNRASEDAPADLAVSVVVPDFAALAERLLPRPRRPAPCRPHREQQPRASGARRGVAGKRRRG